jgi:DHA2 family multidrug resistance protein-like MFS transporter
VAGVAFVTFIACELLTEHPLVDLRVYTNVTFSAASVVILMFFMVFTASTFMQVILMQRLLDYTPAQTGLVLLPGSLALSFGFPLAGRVADRFDRRAIMLGALSIFALSSYLFTFLSLEWPLSWIVWLVMLRFSCGSFVYAPLTATALSQLAPDPG